MISPEIQARIDEARENEPYYQPNERLKEILGNISLVSTIGISSAGKTTLGINAEQLQPERIHNVTTTTTRSPKAGEALAAMHFIPHTEQQLSGLLDDIEQGELVQYMFHPKTHQFYGTRIEDYRPDKHNVMPTMTGGVDKLKTLPLDSYRSVVVVPDILAWQRSFLEAPYDAHERIKRLKEAESSLAWCLQRREEVAWLYNREGKQEEVARKFVELLDSDQDGLDDEAIAVAVQLHAKGVQQLLRAEQAKLEARGEL